MQCFGRGPAAAERAATQAGEFECIVQIYTFSSNFLLQTGFQLGVHSYNTLLEAYRQGRHIGEIEEIVAKMASEK